VSLRPPAYVIQRDGGLGTAPYEVRDARSLRGIPVTLDRRRASALSPAAAFQIRLTSFRFASVTPMLQAMRARPSEFEMYGPFLRHIGSQHLLDFDRRKCPRSCTVRLRDAPGVARAKRGDDGGVFRLENYLLGAAPRPEFASHFRPPGACRRFLARFRRNDNPV
jgi:hypothetical protein